MDLFGGVELHKHESLFLVIFCPLVAVDKTYMVPNNQIIIMLLATKEDATHTQ